MLKFVPAEQTKTSHLFGTVTHMLWEERALECMFYSDPKGPSCLWDAPSYFIPLQFFFELHTLNGKKQLKSALCSTLNTGKQAWCWFRTHKCRWDVDSASLVFLLGLASLPSVVEVWLLWNCHPHKVGLKNTPTLLSSFWLQSLNVTEAKVSELNMYAKKDTQHRWIIYAYK